MARSTVTPSSAQRTEDEESSSSEDLYGASSYTSTSRTIHRPRSRRGTGSGRGIGIGRSGYKYREGEQFLFKNSHTDGSCYVEWRGRPPADNCVPSVSLGANWSTTNNAGRPGTRISERGHQIYAFPFAPTSRSVAAEKRMYYILLLCMIVGLALSAAGFKLADDYLTRYESPEAVNKKQAKMFTAIRYFRWSLLCVGVFVSVICFGAELWCFNTRLGVWTRCYVGGAIVQLKNWWALLLYWLIYIYQLGALFVCRGIWCCWIFNNGIESPFHNPNRDETLRQKCDLGTDSLCDYLKNLSKLLVALGFILLIPVAILSALLMMHPKVVQQKLRATMEKNADMFIDFHDLGRNARCHGDVGIAKHGGGSYCDLTPTRNFRVPHTMTNGEDGRGVSLCEMHRRHWAAYTRNTAFQ